MKIIKKFCLILFLPVIFFVPDAVWTQDVPITSEAPTLVKGVMCESIQKFAPINKAIVFSIELGRVSCFTEFDPVPQKTVIYHKWYHRGTLISEKQLIINPPRWSSFSSMQLRATDKGSWQVDVTDENGKIFTTLLFSITD